VALNFPNNPGIGSIFTDTTAGFSYEWTGTVWKSFAPASSSNIKILDDISGSFTGVATSFSLSTGGVSVTPANAQQLIITLGGVTQEPVTDYTVSSSTIIFTSAPEAALSFSGISLGPAVPIDYANNGNVYVRNTYVGAGTTGPFSFPEGYTVGYLDVYRNGVRLTSSTDYVGTSGTNFFLTTAALSGDEVEAIGYKVASLVQASSNLDNLNVTGITTTGRLQVSTNANIVGIVTIGTAVVGSAVTINSSGISAAAGVVTATSFVGALTGNVTGNATGLSGTPNITVGSVTSGNINSSGILTATTAIVGSGVTINATGINATGILTATTAIVGSGVTVNATGINVTGILTATSSITIGSTDVLTAINAKASTGKAIAMAIVFG